MILSSNSKPVRCKSNHDACVIVVVVGAVRDGDFVLCTPMAKGQTMRFMRCRICGDSYLGTETPKRCPFCGAHEEYIVGPGEYSADENRVQPTEIERADLERAIELERSNTRFYLAMSQMSGDEALASGYKRLSRIEGEHCSVFCKLADVKKPADLGEPSEPPASWCDGIAESVERENMAAAFYAEAVGRATNARIAEVFTAVSAVETDHIALDGEAANIAGC
jgi:rubrerythrin